MAMKKKEQAALAALQKAYAMALALRWTQEVKPDLLPPKSVIGEYTTGYLFNTYRLEVDEAWSGCTNHGRGTVPGRNGSQNSRTLFSTKLLALRAMRHEVEKNAAENLAKIDALIAAEEKEQA